MAANGHGGGPPVARPIFGSDVPWRRWVLIGGGIVAAVIVLGLLGGAVNLITDVMWYDALDRRDVLQTRLWAQIALFAHRVHRDARAGAGQRLAGATDRAAGAGAATRGMRAAGRLAAHRPGAGGRSPCCWRSAAGPPGAAPGRRSSSSSTARRGAPTDPTLGRDIGFYVFDLPFWRFVLGLGLDGPDHRRHPDAGGLCAPGRCAGSSTSPRRCGRTCRSSARCCWSSSPPATSSTSPSWRTRPAGRTATSRPRCTPT